jgi:predicted small lipoprotein YifL
MALCRSSVVGKAKDATRVAFTLAAFIPLVPFAACGLKGPLVQATPAASASAAAIAASAVAPR